MNTHARSESDSSWTNAYIHDATVPKDISKCIFWNQHLLGSNILFTITSVKIKVERNTVNKLNKSKYNRTSLVTEEQNFEDIVFHNISALYLFFWVLECCQIKVSLIPAMASFWISVLPNVFWFQRWPCDLPQNIV